MLCALQLSLYNKAILGPNGSVDTMQSLILVYRKVKHKFLLPTWDPIFSVVLYSCHRKPLFIHYKYHWLWNSIDDKSYYLVSKAQNII